MIGGAAAACFAVLVVIQEPLPKQAAPAGVASLVQEKQYVEMSLGEPTEAELEEPDASVDALSAPVPSIVALAPRASAVAAMAQKSDGLPEAKKRHDAPAV